MTDTTDSTRAGTRVSPHDDAAGATPAFDPRRRRLVGAAIAGAALSMSGAPAIVRAQASPKIRIGFWPVAAGLPFFAAIERGTSRKPGSTSSR